ncbi:MAG TPA: hypothetical protein VG897_09410 [Terriglobales bacterium]|nr:hypothetical protein [Terriglobales bacterium]
MAGQGSTGNVIAALWFILMGWIIHLWSILDAALWKPEAERAS